MTGIALKCILVWDFHESKRKYEHEHCFVLTTYTIRGEYRALPWTKHFWGVLTAKVSHIMKMDDMCCVHYFHITHIFYLYCPIFVDKYRAKIWKRKNRRKKVLLLKMNWTFDWIHRQKNSFPSVLRCFLTFAKQITFLWVLNLKESKLIWREICANVCNVPSKTVVLILSVCAQRIQTKAYMAPKMDIQIYREFVCKITD